MRFCSIIPALTCLVFATHGQSGIPIVCPLTSNLTALTGYNLSSNPDDIRFWFYPKDGSARKEIIYNNNASFYSSGFNQTSVIKTVILIHGFSDNSTVNLDPVVISAYLSANLNYGYIAVDWGLLSGNAPVSNPAQMVAVLTAAVCVSTPVVTQRVTQFINWLTLDPSKVHIIGHSLGAQIAGNVGGQFQQTNGGKSIARITGLDPAGPFYFTSFPFPKINKTNAVFVDIIHTNMGIFGDFSIDGDVDFFPNGGINQPNCTIITDVSIVATDTPPCSHEYAFILYAASITKSFPAYPCFTLSIDAITGLITSTTLFTGWALSFCQWFSTPVQLGENCPPTTTGQYYLATTNPP